MLITVLNLPWSYVVVKTPSAMATECTEAYGLTAEYVQILVPLFSAISATLHLVNTENRYGYMNLAKYRRDHAFKTSILPLFS